MMRSGKASECCRTRGSALGPLLVNRATRSVHVAGRPVRLTRKEFDLLVLLGARLGETCTRREILGALWSGSDGAARTLEVHLASLRSKVGLFGLIETVRGVGYRMVPLPVELSGFVER